MASETSIGPFRIRLDPDEFYVSRRVQVDVRGTPVAQGRKISVEADPNPRGDRVKVDLLDADYRPLFSTVVGTDREVEQLVALGKSHASVVEVGAGLLELLAAARRESVDPSTLKLSASLTDEMFRRMGELAAPRWNNDVAAATHYYRKQAAGGNWGRDEVEMPIFPVLGDICDSFYKGTSGSDSFLRPVTDSYLDQTIIMCRALRAVLPESDARVESLRAALEELTNFAAEVIKDGRIERKGEAEERYGERFAALQARNVELLHQIATTTDKREIRWTRL